MNAPHERILFPSSIFAKLQQRLARAAAVASLASLEGATDIDESAGRELPKLLADLVNDAYETWGELANEIWDLNDRPGPTSEEAQQ